MKTPMINTFMFEDGQKVVDDNLTKEELLKVIEFLSLGVETFKDGIIRRQQLRASKLNTPFLDLVP
jgi:hypothetical protein